MSIAKIRNNDDIEDFEYEQMLSIALNEAGSWCYGIHAIEAWIYSNRTGCLEKGGVWIDPQLQFGVSSNTKTIQVLYDPNSPSFSTKGIQKSILFPGEGLPGALWSETAGRPIKRNSNKRPDAIYKPQIYWRDILGLSIDPDQPPNERLKMIAEAGFRQAAGMPFRIPDSDGVKSNSRIRSIFGGGNDSTRGIVVFLTCESRDMSQRHGRFSSRSNEEYMLTSTQHIGSLCALRKKRCNRKDSR